MTTQALQFQAQAEIERRRRLGVWRVAIIALSDGYEFRGGNLELLHDTTSPEILLAGPAGTGKTVACLTRVHRVLRDHDRARVLMIRKTRASLSETAMQIYEDHVLGEGRAIIGDAQRAYKQYYQYPNGSRLVVGGLDKPSRIMSSEYDLIYIPEVTELTLQDFEMLTTRLRAGKVSVPQIITDANPGAPGHWVKKRADSEKMRFIASYHEDNPILYDAQGTLTERGRLYMRTLDALTGTRYQRLRLGKWVQAEGSVYDDFSNANITTDADYNPDLGAIYWGVDDGYAHGEGPSSASYHPRVVVVAQVNELGGLNIFAEYYATGEADYGETIDNVMALGYDAPAMAYVDSSAAMFRGALSNAGLFNAGATHRVSEGIRNVRRLVCDGNGVRLLRIHPRCTNLVREMQAYRYDEKSSVSDGGERKPSKVDDHGPDALRYLSRQVWSTV